MAAIGIDLGTTYSCVGVFQHGKVEIIANDQGNRTTPSVVAFLETERLIGDAAVFQAGMNSVNTIYGAKRLIGRKYDDPVIQNDMKNWPFKIINEDGKPKICATYKGESKKFSPEEISSMVLLKMKEVSENYLGKSVRDAVITIPAYFNDSQRQATKDAGQIAGLNVLRIINEPTAAALAFGVDKNLVGEKTVLVFDLGGGTFDVSILTIEEGSMFEVLATAGDTHLGGEDFDNILVNYFLDEFKRKTQKDAKENPKALRKLKNATERAKRSLSASTEATIEIDSLHDGMDLYTTITRARFEDLCSNLFRSTLAPVRQVLTDANISKDQIDEVVLVGGSTRIPKIRNILQEFFSGKTLNHSVNPDEAVAYGAAIQAAILSGDTSPKLKDILLVDVTPLSLGIEVIGGEMSKIVERNTKIPCLKTEKYTTTYDFQTTVSIKVHEGERALTIDNNLLGSFDLNGIPPERRGIPKIEVTFDLDANGIFNVTAKEMSTGTAKNIVIEKNKGRLSQADIDKMINDAEKYKEDDRKQREKIAARNKLEGYILDVKFAIQREKSKLSKTEVDATLKLADEIIDWLSGRNSLHQKQEYEMKLAYFKKACDSTISKLDDDRL